MTSANKVTYRAVKELVLNRIRSNVWGPGTTLPGEVGLAKELGCARTTVNRAMRELAEEGFLDRKRKAGTTVNAFPIRKASFVIPLISEEIMATGAPYRYALVSREVLPAPPWLRARIGLGTSDRVLHLQCMHYAASTPFQFEDRWINIKAVPAAPATDFSSIGPNGWLVTEVPFSDVEVCFLAGKADSALAEFLAMAAGDPVFTAERTTWLQQTPITFARMTFAQGYRMTTRL